MGNCQCQSYIHETELQDEDPNESYNSDKTICYSPKAFASPVKPMVSNHIEDRIFDMTVDLEKTFEEDRDTPLDMLFHNRHTRISTADEIGASSSLIYKVSHQSRISSISKQPKDYLDQHASGNDLMNGYGMKIFEDGCKYTGSFRNDSFHGKGTLVWPNGEKFEGKWQNGYTIGNSKLILIEEDGTSIEIGQWVKGKQILN